MRGGVGKDSGGFLGQLSEVRFSPSITGIHKLFVAFEGRAPHG
jgi:hypothetical protein